MIDFNNTYSNLPANFYSKTKPEPASEPQLLAFNKVLSQELGLNLLAYSEHQLAQLFTGQLMPESASSIALAYAGHQFGHFNPRLGDGRALLLGEIVAPDKRRFDIQLKGSGQTDFSRGGDGKSSVGPVIREYIVSEAMHSFGVPTTRALAAALSGEIVYREEALPGAVFTRIASSHIRIGTFEFFAAQRDLTSLKLLADYTINRHYPEILQAPHQKNLYLSFLKQVAERHALLVAKWMSFGFIHGVMNTDNMSISGETLDYGPCAFMDNFSFDKVFSSIDQGGRYAYNNQINIAKWNLCRLADCLIPLVDENSDQAVEVVNQYLKNFIDVYDAEWLKVMAKKLGIFNPKAEDRNLINNFLQHLQNEDLDFTLSFRALSESPDKFSQFRQKWLERLTKQDQSFEESLELMRVTNPVFIPRNHQIERAIQAAISGDQSVFDQLNRCLKNPFLEQTQFEEFKNPPKPEERITATFCGT